MSITIWKVEITCVKETEEVELCTEYYLFYRKAKKVLDKLSKKYPEYNCVLGGEPLWIF